MLLITERWVLRKIAKLRYSSLRKEGKLDKPELERLLTYRRVRGVERNVFIDYLILDHEPITWWRHKLFPVLKYLDFYKGGKVIIMTNDILDQALKDGYLYPFDHCNDEDFDRLKLTKKGYGYISHFYYFLVFWRSTYVQNIIGVLIQWGIPLLALYFVSHFFNINIQSR